MDAFAPVYTGRAAVTPVAVAGNQQRQTGLYVQDQMKWDRWIFIAGLRHDRVTNGVDRTPDERASDTTKRLGVMYQLGGGWTPYFSYAESFTPVSVLTCSVPASSRWRVSRWKSA
ncbi:MULTISPECIES: TonB-dependent receptor domain-containing protein [unclassified Acidovorax]|uniref:TonB-dependent receptor domain-containing protein n=1 Tax=unclassified Acidovorax TaxID=2684926 RepID=UPI003857B6BD